MEMAGYEVQAAGTGINGGAYQPTPAAAAGAPPRYEENPDEATPAWRVAQRMALEAAAQRRRN